MAVVNREDVIIVMEKLNSLRVKQEMSDVTVKVETTEFPCHRVILAAVSNYFYLFFTSDLWTETSRDTTLENVSPETFKIILEYAYTGVLYITNENAFTLLQAGDFLKMNKFLSRCVGYIEGNVKVVDIFDIFVYAVHPLKKFDFARKVARNMVSKFEEITNTEKFLELKFDSLKIMVEEKKHSLKSPFNIWNSCEYNCDKHRNTAFVLNCDKCSRTKPVSIKYDKIRNELVKWMNHDLIDRKKYFGQIAHLTEIPEEYIHAWESSLNCIENQNFRI